MGVEIKSIEPGKLFIPKVTPKYLLNKVAKVALLVLGAPITLVLLASSFKGRMVDWLMKDDMRERCRAIRDNFTAKNKDELEQSYDYFYFDRAADGFDKFFELYPKIATYYSTMLLSSKLNNNEKIIIYKDYMRDILDIYENCSEQDTYLINLLDFDTCLGRDLSAAKKFAEYDIEKYY